MKLRNKKTGEIENWCIDKDVIRTCDGRIIYNSLAELNEEWEDYKEDDGYWFIDFSGYTPGFCEFGIVDKASEMQVLNWDKEIGNYFETKEEAKKAVEKLKAWKRLKDKGFKFTGYDLFSGSSAEDKTEGEFAIGAECSDFVDNKDLDILLGGEE